LNIFLRISLVQQSKRYCSDRAVVTLVQSGQVGPLITDVNLIGRRCRWHRFDEWRRCDQIKSNVHQISHTVLGTTLKIGRLRAMMFISDAVTESITGKRMETQRLKYEIQKLRKLIARSENEHN